MELLDRYIHEVGRHLPRKTRGDIQAELRSLLLDSLDAPDEGEVSQEQVVRVLKEFGAPKDVAASYQPKNQYLIGPELYPLFKLVTGIVLAAVLGSLLLAFGVGVIFGGEPLVIPSPLDVLEYISELFSALMSTFGMLVLVFFILQHLDVRPELDDEEWDPRSLPQVDEGNVIGRTETVVGMAFALVILVILWFFPEIIGIVTTWGQEFMVNPVLMEYIPLISIALLLGITLDLVLLRQGRWTTVTRLVKIGLNLLGIYVLYLLVAGHTAWLAAHGMGGFFAAIEALAENAGTATQAIGMSAFRLAFIIALIVTSLETIGLVFKLLKGVVAPSPPVAPAS